MWGWPQTCFLWWRSRSEWSWGALLELSRGWSRCLHLHCWFLREFSKNKLNAVFICIDWSYLEFIISYKDITMLVTAPMNWTSVGHNKVSLRLNQSLNLAVSVRSSTPASGQQRWQSTRRCGLRYYPASSLYSALNTGPQGLQWSQWSSLTCLTVWVGQLSKTHEERGRCPGMNSWPHRPLSRCSLIGWELQESESGPHSSLQLIRISES